MILTTLKFIDVGKEFYVLVNDLENGAIAGEKAVKISDDAVLFNGNTRHWNNAILVFKTSDYAPNGTR